MHLVTCTFVCTSAVRRVSVASQPMFLRAASNDARKDAGRFQFPRHQGCLVVTAVLFVLGVSTTEHAGVAREHVVRPGIRSIPEAVFG
jgi:hypothetical protein